MKHHQIYTKVIVQAWELLSLDEVKYWGSGVGHMHMKTPDWGVGVILLNEVRQGGGVK